MSVENYSWKICLQWNDGLKEWLVDHWVTTEIGVPGVQHKLVFGDDATPMMKPRVFEDLDKARKIAEECRRQFSFSTNSKLVKIKLIEEKTIVTQEEIDF